ncbi:MAG TPA: 30S ribosomal protein S6--L-glutamate ligase [Sandaracinaceae bacterium LLY-WYZ-13_1]|nr:30S ribosomal protein S6--L-glutamate ligase [Sandaracinaceae bacterium LLY-WYZ-13_1]
MKIVILSRARHSYSTRRLREACLARGHKVRVLDTLRFTMAVEQGHPQLYYRDKMLSRYDAVIPRIGASVTFYGTAVVRQFEQLGTFTLSSSHAISVSRDKLRSLQVLSRHNIGIPATHFVRDRQSVIPAIERLGGAPVIVKVLEGTQGVGVILAETMKVAEAIIETLHGAKQNVLIQKFVRESRGRDIRAFVVGGHVVAAMRRVAQGDEFRSNVHRGGRTEKVELDPEYERTAIHAAQIMGLRVAGVDMLESDDGPQVMEVNSSPGLEGIEKATDVDVAGQIVEHIEDQFLLPEIDLKQRLTLDKGYGVAEFDIAPTSELAGQTLRELALGERDVTVLSIQRGSVVIPNPRGDAELLRGDHVVCYGKLLALKQLIPRDARGRRKPLKVKKKAGKKKVRRKHSGRHEPGGG